MTTKRVKMNKELIFSIFTLAVLVDPAYFRQIPLLESIYDFLKIIISIAIIIWMLFEHRKIDIFIVAVVALELELLFSTLLNGESFFNWYSAGSYSIIFAIYMKIMMERRPFVLIDAISYVFGTYVHINLLCTLIFPDGMYTDMMGWRECYFLGLDNVAGMICLLALFVALYRIFLYRKRIMLWDLLVVISVLTFFFMRQIATSIIAVVVFFFFLYSYRHFAFFRWAFNARVITVIGIVMFILIQFFGVQSTFSGVFSLLGKNTTLSGRTLMWANAWLNLLSGGSKRWLFGFGMLSSSEAINQLGFWWAAQLHCLYLQMIYFGGITGFVLFVVVMMNAANRFDKGIKDSNSYLFLAGYFAVLIIYQVEAYSSLNMLMIFFTSLLCRSEHLVLNSGITENARIKEKE